MARRSGKSEAAFERACKVIVSGEGSPRQTAETLKAVPPIIAKAKGSTITDVDDNTYIDYVGGFGPALLGHAPEEVVTAINKAVRRGISFGSLADREVRLAEIIVASLPAAEKVRFVSSGTEATMTAVQLARKHTGRDHVLMFRGCFHGHYDRLLTPSVSQKPDELFRIVPYNDLDALTEYVESAESPLACLVIEPVAANMGVVPPAEGYLQGVRELCDRTGTVLVFDEFITSFRVAYGGAQVLYDVRPDLTILGKVIGGGMPLGAVAGPGEIMDRIAARGPVYQAGPMSGNPAAIAAGIATVQSCQAEGFYDRLDQLTGRLQTGFAEAARQANLEHKVTINRVGSMMSVFFTPGPVVDLDSASKIDLEAFVAYFGAMLEQGIFLPPSMQEAMFISAAHTDDDIDRTIAAAGKAFAAAAEHA